MGMSHVGTGTHPSDWGCGPQNRGPMGGSGKQWSRCNEMDFRRLYTKLSDDWCLPGKEHENHTFYFLNSS